MMIYVIGDMIKCVYIAGPRHQLLGLRCVTQPVTQVEILNDPHSSDVWEPSVNSDMLLEVVKLGLIEAGKETGICLYPNTVEYVPTDTPDYARYFEMARLIGLKFAEAL